MKEISKLSAEQMKRIGDRITKALAITDVKQKDVAKELDIEDNRISKFCSGVLQPNLAQLIKISKLLNVSADYLLGLSEVPQIDPKSESIYKELCDLRDQHEQLIADIKNLIGKSV